VSQEGYVNLLPFVRGEGGYLRGYSGGCQHLGPTPVLLTTFGTFLKIRKTGTAEPGQEKVHEIPGIPSQVMRPIKTWREAESGD
jgi:hypothetical protein